MIAILGLGYLGMKGFFYNTVLLNVMSSSRTKLKITPKNNGFKLIVYLEI